ncbi:hypothetical protein OG955_04555 [Streptomyces sp. NBC_01602]|nr:hypothetical protein OG955_04555 [Streptomyces sp. NBC_01602]
MRPPFERPDVRAVHRAVVQVQQVGAAQLAQRGGVQTWPDACLGPVPNRPVRKTSNSAGEL